MTYDIYAFGEVCLYVIPLAIFVSLFFNAVLSTIAKHSPSGVQVTVLLSYLFAFGVIVHECAHRLFCTLFGVRVKATQYFGVSRQRSTSGAEHVSIGGYVECDEVTSVIVALFLGFAPLLINGLLIALLAFYGPLLAETDYVYLAFYAGISLVLGIRLSKEDALLWTTVLKKHFGRGFLEFLLLLAFGGLLYYLVGILQVELWITLTVVIAFPVLLALATRFRAKRPGYAPDGFQSDSSW
jgi:hypothetical protein